MTTREIADLHARCGTLSDLDRPTRDDRRELEAVRRQIDRLSRAEREAGMAELLRREEAAEATPELATDSLGIAEIGAACEIEGTPLAPVATYARPIRRCVECGSLVYGEYCTHCMES